MRRLLLPLAIALLAHASAFANATIVIVNNDTAGVGFNDPTPAAPVGGNPGVTLGQQRLNVFRRAAEIWGAALDSPIEISVLSNFVPLPCTAASGTLGSAGPRFIFFFTQSGGVGLFPGPLLLNTWHPSALASKRVGTNLLVDIPPPPPGNPPNTDIRARFNSDLGKPGCLTGFAWYLGLDNHAPVNAINLLTVVLHEFSHGLGFLSLANPATGQEVANMGDVFGAFAFDSTVALDWNHMTDAQRAASALNARHLVWEGATVRSDAPGVLAFGRPLMRVNTPPAIAGVYDVGAAAFGPPLNPIGVSGSVVLALDPADAAGPSTTDACSPLTNAAAVAGKIALVDRGTCTFVVKVKNAQNAGAIGVLVADNVADMPPPAMAGVDPTITIPSVRIAQAAGTAIKAQLGAGVSVTLAVDTTVLSGADPQGRVFLNATNPVVPGSTVSHWDPVANPNLLMEPIINPDLTLSVKPPQDLTLSLMRDIGWFPDADNDGLADDLDACAMSNRSPTVMAGGVDTGVSNVLFASGCTMNDYIASAAANAGNHGDYVSDVTHLVNDWRDAGLIDNADRKAIHDAAVHSSTGK
jgi:hypothetical protein